MDKNGFLEKAEIAVLIKRVFRRTTTQIQKESIKAKEGFQKKLSEYLGEYAEKYFKVDIDELWEISDIDKNGMLDKEECKVFMKEIQK